MGVMYHVKNTAKCGTMDLVSLGLFLNHLQTSENTYKLEALESNPEVMAFRGKNFLQFISEEDFVANKQAEVTAAAEKAAAIEEDDGDVLTAVSKALAEDNPNKATILKCVNGIEHLLATLKAELEAKPVPKATATIVPHIASVSSDQPADAKNVRGMNFEDGLDLPMNAPMGMTPQVTTKNYLLKDTRAKRDFLITCQSSTILRDIALFETDPILKKRARKVAKQAEASAIAAESLANAV